MRIWLVLFSVALLVSCGPRERQVERPDEAQQITEVKKRGGSFGLFGGRKNTDPLATNIVYGSLVPEVLSLRLDRTADGIIILATTQVGGQSAFDVSLRELNSGLPNEDGVISFEFRYDVTRQLQPPLRDRVITVAEYVSNAQLDDVRGIQVFAAQNSRSVRR